MPRLADRAGNGGQVTRQLGDSLAKLHSIDGDTAARQLDQPKIDQPVADALALMRTLVHGLLQPEPALS